MVICAHILAFSSRKNYLFVGSDEGGKRAAMMYSFFASCKIHNLNPLEWLTDAVRRIPNHPINQIDELLPHKWGQGYQVYALR